MPWLKALPTPSRRCTVQPGYDTHADHEQRRAFDLLLNPVPPRGAPTTPLPLDDARPQRAGSALTQAFAPEISQLRSLGRRSPGTLDLRLTNGPLAGLEIQASAQDSLLCLNIKVADCDAFERIVGPREALASELEAAFNRPVALTLLQPNGETWCNYRN